MARLKVLKAALIFGWLSGGVLLMTAGSSSHTPGPAAPAPPAAEQQPAATQQPRPQQPDAAKQLPARPANQKPSAEYVGAETCKGCHEPQAAHYTKTAHSRLEREPSWKGRVTGCEACHGPGSAHVELMAGGEQTAPGHRNIRTLSTRFETAKQISDTCLACHAGREEHNNFRRGEHWRNNVGCTDCHYSHQPDPAPPRPESHALVGDWARRRLDTSALRLLRDNEPQLCLSCHTEQKAQFTLPFRHKVLEGVVRCSDCHNPHGGFENRQQRLTTGTDASCMKCHTDKQGPFVFEHAPVRVEGCSICHTPHGSANPKLLTRSHVFQMCIECHTNAHQLVLREDGEGAPAPPGFHNLTQERIRNCTTCHTAIHGSNSHNFFFRR